MAKNIGFKVTAEFECPNMVDEEIFREKFDCDPMSAYNYYSDNFKDGPFSFSEDPRIIKVELLKTNKETTAALHARQIVKKLTSRPHLPLVDGVYNGVDDEVLMIGIVEEHLIRNNLVR